MRNHKIKSLVLVTILCLGLILPALSAPSLEKGRKYIVKSNNPKKVFHKQVQVIEQQQYQQQQQQQQQHHQPASTAESSNANAIMQNKAADVGNPSDIGANGFPWSFITNSLMQLVRTFFGVPNEMVANGLTPGSDKMDGPSVGQGFSWGKVIGYGLKLLFAALGGPTGNNSVEHDGIDKIGVEGGESPAQGLVKTLISVLINGEEAAGTDNMAKKTGELINLTVALMNALKQSFSQRAMRARSLGEKDKLTEMTLAAIDMGKAYVRSFNTTSDVCKELRICEAASECVKDVGNSNAYGICHFSAYATANLMYYTQGSVKDNTKRYLEAARKGRSQQHSCKTLYSMCNEVA